MIIPLESVEANSPDVESAVGSKPQSPSGDRPRPNAAADRILQPISGSQPIAHSVPSVAPPPSDPNDLADMVLFAAPAVEVAEVELEIVNENHDQRLVREQSTVADNSKPAGTDQVGTVDNSNAIWYVHLPSGQRLGPANNDSMLQWVAEGHIPATALVWRDGWPEWKFVAAILNLQKTASFVTPHAQPAGRAFGATPQPAVDILNVPISETTVYRRNRSYPSATVTFVLLGLVVALFAVLLYVFFLRNSHPRQTTLLERRAVQEFELLADISMLARCMPC